MNLTTGFAALALAAISASGPAAPPAHRHAADAARKPAPIKTVAYANIGALLEPSSDGFVNAVQVYPWSEGAVYRLFTAPGLVSDIAMQPGESLISVAAGDTVRWVIGDTSSGAGAARRTHVLVKPIAAGLRTNLVIATDRRVYLVALASTPGPGMAAISWSYPMDQLIAYRAAEAAAPAAQGVAVDRLNFNYRIDGDRPLWRPVRAFDDGTQTFIEFPASVVSGEIPPLFVIGASGEAELVNYRLKGRYYVVDRLFGRAELRLGAKHQAVVWITRSDPVRRGRS